MFVCSITNKRRRSLEHFPFRNLKSSMWDICVIEDRGSTGESFVKRRGSSSNLLSGKTDGDLTHHKSSRDRATEEKNSLEKCY